MKFLPLLLVATALFLAPPARAASESVQQVLSDAQTAYYRGDLAAAKKSFAMVLELDPRNPTATNFMRMIKSQEASAPKGNDSERQLTGVVIPKVEFRETTLGSAFEFLRQQVAKASGGKAAVNFVLQLPPDRLNGQMVSLQLTNVPATESIRYLADLANLQVEYQKYAVKVTAKGPAPGVVAAPSPVGSDTPTTPAVPGL